MKEQRKRQQDWEQKRSTAVKSSGVKLLILLKFIISYSSICVQYYVNASSLPGTMELIAYI